MSGQNLRSICVSAQSSKWQAHQRISGISSMFRSACIPAPSDRIFAFRSLDTEEYESTLLAYALAYARCVLCRSAIYTCTYIFTLRLSWTKDADANQKPPIVQRNVRSRSIVIIIILTILDSKPYWGKTDKSQQIAPSDQCLHCYPLIQQFLITLKAITLDLSKF